MYKTANAQVNASLGVFTRQTSQKYRTSSQTRSAKACHASVKQPRVKHDKLCRITNTEHASRCNSNEKSIIVNIKEMLQSPEQ